METIARRWWFLGSLEISIRHCPDVLVFIRPLGVREVH